MDASQQGTAWLSRALLYRQFGPPGRVLQLELTELPPLVHNVMRVRMLASGINPSDLIPITGAYGHRITPPMMAGYEGVTAPCAKYGAQRSL